MEIKKIREFKIHNNIRYVEDKFSNCNNLFFIII